MRLLLLPLVALLGASLAGCKEEVPKICGFSTEPPETEEGRGTAKGEPEDLDEPATWKPGTPGDTAVTIGVLVLTIPKEENGSSTDDLIDDGAFPICVRLGERDEKTGGANWVENGAVTGPDHEGAVALLSNDDNILVGRFEVDMKSPQGEEVSFTDGVFAARLNNE